MISLPQKLHGWFRGDADAVNLVLILHSIVETWDDLIDQDKPISSAQISTAFHNALITLPRNAFYQRNFARLNPLIEAAIVDWLSANEFERSHDAQKITMAYGLRYTLYSVTALIAAIIGGLEWATTVNMEFRALAEPWSAYAREHGVG